MSLKLGLNKDVSNKDYHADQTYLSSSNLKMLLKDPQKFYQEKILGIREPQSDKPHFVEGSYAHSLILEPHLVEEEYAFFPGWKKVGKDWKAFQEENKDLTILSKPQKIRVERWYSAYMEREEALDLIRDASVEETLCVDMDGVPIKVRADAINAEKGFIADVKTTAWVNDHDTFKGVVEQFSYDLSAALYCRAFEQHYGKPFEFYFIVLGKKDDTCQVYRLSKETREKGDKQVSEALATFKRRKKNNDWEIHESYYEPETDGDYEILEV